MSSVDLDSDSGCASQAIEMGDIRPTMQTDTSPMETETETLKALDGACVKHVPRLEYGGDLPEPLMCVAEFERDSRYGEGRAGSRGCNQLAGDSSFAGVPPEKVKSSRMILEVIRRAFIVARQQMLERCGAPHGGSSGGNIADRTEALSDWGLAGRVRAGGRRRRDRTGTYQFMSYKLVMDPKSRHELHDDLESFFWVMVYHNLRYLQYAEGVSLEFRQTTMKIVFGSTRNSHDNLARREWGKAVFLSDPSFRPRLNADPCGSG
ncbi:hypothetical protein BD779DRAFT_436398 [Infundibulicybe gibba]|nr:hypothetical protein BD779DRAFT_436398 [Infundibulicybe gibba]